MTTPVVSVGEKLHIITRRNYKEDLRRHFVGVATAVDGPLVRVEGYVFVFNSAKLEYCRRPELRTRIFGLDDSQFIVNVMPPSVVIDRLRYVVSDDRLVVTDGPDYALDVNEFGANS